MLTFRIRQKILSWQRTLQRWRHSRYQRHFEWQFKPAFWKWRSFIRGLQIRLGQWGFAWREHWSSLQDSVSISRLFVGLIAQQTFLALGLVSITLCLQAALSSSGITGLDRISQALSGLISSAHRLDSAAYDAVLYTLVAVASTLLGLYFTTIYVVVGNAYAQVPGDVRQLLAQEKIGNRYIRAVALLASTALLLLTAHALGQPPGVVPLLVVVGLAMFALLGFAQMALRVLDFFDVTTLLNHLTPEITRWIRAATPRGFAWRDPSFQAAYQKSAARSLQTYVHLIDVAIARKDLHGERLASLGSRSLILLQFYVAVKADIPLESLWFERISQRRDWLVSSSMEISTSLMCGTPLTPQTTPDLLWFEKRISKIVVRIMRHLLDENEFLAAANLASQVQKTLWLMGAHFAVEEGAELHRAVYDLVLAKVQNEAITADDLRVLSPDRQRDVALLLAIVDSLGLALINLQLGLIHQLPAQTEANFESVIEKIDWRRSGALHKIALCGPAKRELESLQQQLAFEVAIEGHTITPSWYQTQTAARGMARTLGESYTRLADEWEISFVKRAQNLQNENQFIFAAQIVECGLEACDRFCAHLESVKTCFETMKQMRRDTDDKWPETDWEALNARVLLMRRRLIEVFGQLATRLATIPAIADVPDFFGHSYMILAQECADALQEDEKLFATLFPNFFDAVWLAHDRVLHDYQNKAHDSFLMVHSLEPLVDLMTISGLALIYSELDGKDFWQHVCKIWDSALETSQDVSTVLKLLNHAGEQTIQPRISVRMNWERQLKEVLREHGLKERIFDPATRQMTPGIDHPSPLIRDMSSFGFGQLSHQADELFAASYLMKRPEASAIEWNFLFEQMAQRLERSAKRSNQSPQS